MSLAQMVDNADAICELATRVYEEVRIADPGASYSMVFQTVRAMVKMGCVDIQPAPAGWTSVGTSHD